MWWDPRPECLWLCFLDPYCHPLATRAEGDLGGLVAHSCRRHCQICDPTVNLQAPSDSSCSSQMPISTSAPENHFLPLAGVVRAHENWGLPQPGTENKNLKQRALVLTPADLGWLEAHLYSWPGNRVKVLHHLRPLIVGN